MKILVTGASGFIGTHLCKALIIKGHHVTGVGTSAHYTIKNSESSKNRGLLHESSERLQEKGLFEWISADTTIGGKWQDKVKESDVIINLTGKSIFGYWTQKYKDQIYQSRVFTTKNIVEAIADGKKTVLLNTSAVGYYGDRGDDALTESDPAGKDFLAKVCVDWENSALKAQSKGSRVVLMRFGVVLGKNGGAISKMLPAFKFFAGGPLGKGVHWFPWIHKDDLVNAIIFLMENGEISGAVNLVAPELLRHREFAYQLGHALNRPSFMPAPAFMIKTIMGEMGEAFLSSQKAYPSVLKDRDFRFKYGDIKSALEEIL